MSKILLFFSFKNISLFIFFGLCIGLPLGIYTLTIGPNRMISDKAIAENWDKNYENWIQKIAIFTFCILVFLISFFLVKFFNKWNSKNQKLVLVFCLISLLISFYIFSFKPEMLITNRSSEESFEKNDNIEFYFGSYPDNDKIQELKSQNYTAIISLLHKLVIPAEPILMKKEAENAKKNGLKLISIPMLPWIIENDSAIVKIKQLAKNAKGKYYVHCYLGKDRVNVFRSIIEKENKLIQIKNKISSRNIDTISNFERGKIYKLNNEIYFTPFPTDEEFFSFVFNGKIKTVVSLMNPIISGEKPFVIREKKIMKQYNMNFKNFPIKYSETDKIKSLINDLKKLPKPILIHQFSTQSIDAERFIENFKNKLSNN